MGVDTRQYVEKGTKSSWRFWKRALKKSVAKLARRLGKKHLEDAPPRATVGTTR